MEFAIKNRLSGVVQFTAEIECAHDAAIGIKIGLAVRWARRSDADLRGAVLSDADLRDADLRGAVLSDADLSDADLRDADLRGAVLSDADLRDADLRDAVLSDADLRDADLRGADLSDADLRDADLRGAVLSDADLSDADLRGADLSDADLRGADLSDADLRGADLSDADLRGADLSDADLRGADLSDADLRGADLRDADLRGAVLSGNLKGVPVVPNIDAAILAAIEAGGELDMTDWHTCETTHCRAGWAITLAGAGGAALEFALGSAAAGALIYAASRPGVPVPDFYASNEDAMADMRAAAAAGEATNG